MRDIMIARECGTKDHKIARDNNNIVRDNEVYCKTRDSIWREREKRKRANDILFEGRQKFWKSICLCCEYTLQIIPVRQPNYNIHTVYPWQNARLIINKKYWCYFYYYFFFEKEFNFFKCQFKFTFSCTKKSIVFGKIIHFSCI